MRIPPRARAEQMTTVPELISSLSLLDPDRGQAHRQHHRRRRQGQQGPVQRRLVQRLWSTGLDRDAASDRPAQENAAASAGAGQARSAGPGRHRGGQARGGRADCRRASAWRSLRACSSGLTTSLKDVQAAVKPTTPRQPASAASLAAGHRLPEATRRPGQGAGRRARIPPDPRRPPPAGEERQLPALPPANRSPGSTWPSATTPPRSPPPRPWATSAPSAGEGTMAHALENARARQASPTWPPPCATRWPRSNSYQTKVRLAQNTFAGLSLGSILVLLALGLSIIFGLMGVINMAHGEFMMVGAFTTYVVSEWFKAPPARAAFDYYLIAAVPAAFLVVGVRRLGLRSAGRPPPLRPAAGNAAGDLGHRPDPDPAGPLHVRRQPRTSRRRTGWRAAWKSRRTCLGPQPPVHHRSTAWSASASSTSSSTGPSSACCCGPPRRTATWPRRWASPTRRVDALTFAFGAGLAGLAGVAVPLYDKINPQHGPGLHRRLLHGRRGRRRRQAGRRHLGGAGPRVHQQVPRASSWRRSRPWPPAPRSSAEGARAGG